MRERERERERDRQTDTETERLTDAKWLSDRQGEEKWRETDTQAITGEGNTKESGLNTCLRSTTAIQHEGDLCMLVIVPKLWPA